MVTISEGAFAKVNLTLDVLGKREDGYHNIKSIMQTISLHDDVTVDIGTGAPWPGKPDHDARHRGLSAGREKPCLEGGEGILCRDEASRGRA